VRWTAIALVGALFSEGLRKRAIDRAVAFVEERLNGEDGLGAIYPAMAYSRSCSTRWAMDGKIPGWSR